MLKLNTKVIENFVAEEECNIATTTRVTAAVAADIIATTTSLMYNSSCMLHKFSSITTANFLFATRNKCCRKRGTESGAF